ncbi:MAG TPA: hypothetical protein VJ044_02675, partial [Candidatus Hodarchaeales archaeon]|nr:hypothetical protein [Candidatus Hodarchaeales archaeon]
APDYKTADLIRKGVFPDYGGYQKASKEGFSTFQEWSLKQQRQTKLSQIIDKVRRMPQRQFMEYMKFRNESEFLDWLIALPKDLPVGLDAEMVFLGKRVDEKAIKETMARQDLFDDQHVNSIKESLDLPNVPDQKAKEKPKKVVL